MDICRIDELDRGIASPDKQIREPRTGDCRQGWPSVRLADETNCPGSVNVEAPFAKVGAPLSSSAVGNTGGQARSAKAAGLPTFGSFSIRRPCVDRQCVGQRLGAVEG